MFVDGAELVVKRGVSFEVRVYLFLDTSEVPRPLTGLTVRSFIESDYGRFELSARISDPLAGEITAEANNFETERWHPGAWKWDLALYEGEDFVEAVPPQENIKIRVIKGPTL